MINKVQKYQEELEKNGTKMAALKERSRELEQKIREAETLEIYALMRSEKLTMEDLITLARSRKENQGLPSFTSGQGDVTDDAPDNTLNDEADVARRTAAYDDTDDRREHDMEDEDDDY